MTLAAPSFAGMQYIKIASDKPGDPKNIANFIDILGAPAINSHGDVFFKAATSSGDKIFKSVYSPETQSYGLPFALASGTGIEFGNLFASPAVNDAGDYAYAQGNLNQVPVTISGCGLPNPGELKNVRGLKLLKTDERLSAKNLKLPKWALDKDLNTVKPFQTVISSNNLAVMKNGQQIAKVGDTLCEGPQSWGGLTYYIRTTITGITTPVSLNSSGMVVFMADHIYREVFGYFNERGRDLSAPDEYGVVSASGIISNSGGSNEIRLVSRFFLRHVDGTELSNGRVSAPGTGRPSLNDAGQIVVPGGSWDDTSIGYQNNILVVDTSVVTGRKSSIAKKDGIKKKLPRYDGPPTIDDIFPSSGREAGGDTIDIHGQNFLPGTTVSVGGHTAAVTVIDPGHIRVITPNFNGAYGRKDIVVNNRNEDGEVTRENAFTVSNVVSIYNLNNDFGGTPGVGTPSINNQGIVTLSGSGGAHPSEGIYYLRYEGPNSSEATSLGVIARGQPEGKYLGSGTAAYFAPNYDGSGSGIGKLVFYWSAEDVGFTAFTGFGDEAIPLPPVMQIGNDLIFGGVVQKYSINDSNKIAIGTGISNPSGDPYHGIYAIIDSDVVHAHVFPGHADVSAASEVISFSAADSTYPNSSTPHFSWKLIGAPSGAVVKPTELTTMNVEFSLNDFLSKAPPGKYQFELALSVPGSSSSPSKTQFYVDLLSSTSTCGVGDGTTCVNNDGPMCPVADFAVSCNSDPCKACSPVREQKGKPVNVATGAMWDGNIDFVVPGRTPYTSLRMERTYVANAAAAAGDFGPNWRHGYETKLERAILSFAAKRSKLSRSVSPNDLVWLDEGGGATLFKDQGNGFFAAAPGVNIVIKEYSDRYELVRPDRSSLVYSKNPFGKVIAMVDPHGESVTFTYDGNDRLASASSGLAGTITFLRNAQGRISEVVRERDNLRYTYTYDGDGRLQRATDYAGRSYQYEYVSDRPGTFAQGMLAKITDPLNRILVFNYNNDGTAKNQTQHGNAVMSFAYGANKTDVTEIDGTTTRYIFDQYKRLVQKIHPDKAREYQEWGTDGFVSSSRNDYGGSTKFTYDVNGNVTSIKRPEDPSAKQITYDLNFNRPTLIQPLAGAATSYTIEQDNGNVLSMNRNGLSLTYTYDTFGNLLSTNNGKMTYVNQRDSNGLLTNIFDLHNSETRQYDSRGRMVSRQFQNGRTLGYSYNEDDFVLVITDSHGPSITRQYDVMNRLIQETRSVGGNSQATSYVYDDRDRLVSTTDALGRTTTFQYDPVHVIDKPTSVTDPAGRVTQFFYDVRQRLAKKIDALGGVTSYTYDQRSNLTSVLDANGGRTTYAYDLNDRKIREARQSVAGSSAAERVTLYFYDQASRLVREVTKSATGGQDRAIVYEYDQLDRLVKRTVQREGSSGSVVEDESTFAYENQLDANLMSSAVNGVANLSFANEAAPPFSLTGFNVAASQSGNPLGLIEGSFAISRDVSGEIASVAKDGTYVFQKTFDPAGRMLSGTLPGGNSTFGYDGFGRRNSVVHSDGHSGSFQMDLLNRLTQVTWTGATPISETLGYDLAGNITSLEREGSSPSTIAYDAVDQILSSVGGSTEVRSSTLDQLGNRLTDSLNGSGNFISNFLTSNGIASYLADPDGFGDTVREIKGGITKNFTYRADGRISGYQSGSTQVGYFYDGLGRLAAKAINDGVSSYTQSFLYIGQDKDLLQAKAGDGTITTYLNGNGPDDHLAESKGGVYKGYLTDHINSVLSSDMAGPQHRFSLFGGATGSAPLSTTSDPASFGFAGGMHNRESQTTKFDWRDLNHETGRWQSMDPIGYRSKDSNYFRYALNNPLKFTDPTGLASKCHRPLSFLPIEVGQAHHEYVCVTNKDGTVTCGGLGPNGFPLVSPGVIEPDDPNETCVNVDIGPQGCMDACLAQVLKEKPPIYLIKGSNCQDFAQNAVAKCTDQCGIKK